MTSWGSFPRDRGGGGQEGRHSVNKEPEIVMSAAQCVPAGRGAIPEETLNGPQMGEWCTFWVVCALSNSYQIQGNDLSTSTALQRNCRG